MQFFQICTLQAKIWVYLEKSILVSGSFVLVPEAGSGGDDIL
jgi:hypothetical protein